MLRLILLNRSIIYPEKVFKHSGNGHPCEAVTPPGPTPWTNAVVPSWAGGYSPPNIWG
jgi:hypothetical protein